MKIPVGGGRFALIDEADFGLVCAFTWRINSGFGYAVTRRPRCRATGEKVYMHRLIVGARPHEHIDHANGDTLDNRRSNLRVCTQSQNLCNRGRTRANRSGFKGVRCKTDRGRRSSPWQANIRLDGRQTHLGYFATAEDAARAYDTAALKHYGEFARLNFGPQRIKGAA